MRPYLDDLLWLAIIVPVVVIVLIAVAQVFRNLFKDMRTDKWLVFLGVLLVLGAVYSFVLSFDFSLFGAHDQSKDKYAPIGLVMLLAGLLSMLLPMLRNRK